MKLIPSLVAPALLAGSLLGQQPLTAPAPQPTPAAAPASVADLSPTPVPTPSLVDNIIKLWKANLSEDFLRKYISSADLVKDLTAEDIIKLRNAGLPENLIFLVTDRKQALSSVPPAAAASVPTAPPTAAPTATPAPTPVATARWEGLARRNSGIVLIKSRWDPGVLEFKDETLRWTDARDAAKNVLLTAKQMTEQQLTCLKKSFGNECFEWVVRAKGQEYRFRDVGWEQGDNAKATELYAFFKSLYPGLVASQVPVEEK